MVIESVCGGKATIVAKVKTGHKIAPRGVYSASFSQLSKGALGTAPLSISTTCPCLKIIIVGSSGCGYRNGVEFHPPRYSLWTKRLTAALATSSKIGASYGKGRTKSVVDHHWKIVSSTVCPASPVVH
ncbi:hypothetical protein KCP74_12060 [Salmonella enterica subsp. enterica]|nr:hypothetical protein KCP74_12060 [Salmonella enterica subsp. enterica]